MAFAFGTYIFLVLGISFFLFCLFCRYFFPKPNFFYYDDINGTICKLFLPSNAAMHQLDSAPQSSMEAAKKDACLRACKRLHELGALTDYLLPDQADEDEDLVHDFSDLEFCDG